MEKLESYVKLPDSLLVEGPTLADPVIIVIWAVLFFCGAIALASIFFGDRDL